MDRSWLNELAGLRRGPAPRRARPRLEALEERSVPALAITDLASGLTPAQLANALVGNGIAVSNVQYTGSNLAGGLFSGGTGIVGFESGVILSAGRVVDAVGPNNAGTSGTDLGQPGDADLDAITGNPTNDASVLRFDFIPQGGALSFQYVFGSEEYNELANAAVSDVFALYVNGVNVALVPGTNTAVTIDTVNLTMNPQFYVNNAESSDANPATPPLRDTQLDGLTVVLTATATVNPGVVNTIKLAVADVIDTDMDSTIFFRAGSFQAPLAPSFVAYRPLRYAFHSLEQNLGLSGPVLVGGPATQESFDGNLTLLNFGTAASVGDLRVTLRDLPPGVQLLNRSGLDATTGDPFIIVQGVSVPVGGTVPLRVPVKLSNPGLFSLGTFFVGPYFVDVSSA